MKTLHYLLIFSLLFTLSSVQAQNDGREFYQLKIYEFANKEQEKKTDEYLENALIPALHRQGFKDIGVFKLIPPGDSIGLKTFILLPFQSFEQFMKIDTRLGIDTRYQSAAADYINAPHDQPGFARYSSTLMKAFVDMPHHTKPKLENDKSERIYELRSYEGPTDQLYKSKVDMFNAGGEIKLFDKLNFNALFYAEVISGPKMPNLIYMTTHENAEKRGENWKAFVDSPEWKELLTIKKYENTVSHADIWLLRSTAYSDF